MTTGSRPRLLTGDRPTGALHLGHYVGTLRNRVALQRQYDCFFIVADVHMLTTKSSRDDILDVRRNAPGLVLDAISAGIDPETVTFYLQSGVPEIHEISGLFQSLVTVARLERLPALKDMAGDANIDMSLALLAYPVLQSADILSVRATAVPVGKDNFAFVEVTREIARRFNQRYEEIFPIPEIIASDVPTLVGTDGGAKMGKSLGNAINLGDSRETVEKKVRGMFTDPNRIRADMPGRVEGNPVFIYLDAFGVDTATINDLKTRYREGRVGDVAVKGYLSEVINAFLNPMRERRAAYDNPDLLNRLLREGTERMRAETVNTCKDIKRAMGLRTVHRNIL